MHVIPDPANSGLPYSGYLLIEPGNIDSGVFGAAPPMYRCTPAALSNAHELTPRLIDLAALSPSQQEQMQYALRSESVGNRPPAICAWLICSLKLADLARHIGRFLVGPGIDGAPVLWRYHDPRVFSLALHVLSPAQCDALLGPITEWRLPWCGNWWSVRGPGHDIEPLEGIAPAWPSSAQWLALRDSELVARALAQLRDGPEEAIPDDIVGSKKLVALAIQEGRERLLLSGDEDLLEYAVLRARYGDAFRFHPKLAVLWTALRAQTMYWSDVHDLLSESDRKQLDTQRRQTIAIGAKE